MFNPFSNSSSGMSQEGSTYRLGQNYLKIYNFDKVFFSIASPMPVDLLWRKAFDLIHCLETMISSCSYLEAISLVPVRSKHGLKKKNKNK